MGQGSSSEEAQPENRKGAADRMPGAYSPALEQQNPRHIRSASSAPPNDVVYTSPHADATTPVEERPRSRRNSFGFLRRSKSGENQNGSFLRRGTGSKLTKRKKRKEEEAAHAVPHLPRHLLPQLDNSASATPPHSSHDNRTGTYNPTAYYGRYKMDSTKGYYQAPSAPSIQDSTTSPPVDPLARTESITNRGRYSYASSLVSNTNSPRRLRRRKDPTPMNILVLGSKNCGKTSFIEFLRNSLNRPVRPRVATNATSPPPPPTSSSDTNSPFTSHYLETEMEGERIGLTIYDSYGLERSIVDLQLREISAFLESKFQETFNEEQKVMRVTNVKDTHIHCVFLLLDPGRLDANIAVSRSSSFSPGGTTKLDKTEIIGGLDKRLDVNVLQTLQGKTTVIPVISKADAITTAHMAVLKRTVWESLRKLKFDPLEALNLDSDNESDYDTAASEVRDSSDDDNDSLTTPTNTRKEPQSQSTPTKVHSEAKNNLGLPPDNAPTRSKTPQHDDIRLSTMSVNVDLPALPLSVISPDVYDPGTVGRRFPWGLADPYNTEHCDFVKLKDSVFSEWRSELRELSRNRWYENWRTSRLNRQGQPTSQPSRGPYGIRAVSGAAAYGGNPPMRSSAFSAPHERAVSTNQIGVAVGEQPPPGQGFTIRQRVN